jgi:hypothetical protein
MTNVYEPFEHLLDNRKIKLRGSDDIIWTYIENVIRDVNGHPLYLVDRDGIVYPWHSIEYVAPLGR